MKRFIHHICIQTNDYSASKNFYETLGFTLAKESQGFHSRDYNSWLKMDHFYIELQTAKQGELLRDFSKHSAGPVHFCLYIEDLQKEVARLQVLGLPFAKKNGQVLYDVEGSHLAKIVAPEGTIIELRDSF